MKKMPDARKTSHGKGLGKLMAVLPKAMCRLSAILFRIVMLFFTEGERHILKIHREAQKQENACLIRALTGGITPYLVSSYIR